MRELGSTYSETGDSMKIGLKGGVVALAMLFPSVVLGQDPHQMAQMQRMQEQAQLMQESMQVMQRLQTRAQEMEQLMAGQIERIREQTTLHEQDRVRLRDQERIRDMAHAVSTAAREMVQAMERARDMLGDPMGPTDPEMHREMERLREQMNLMASPMEESLAILEQMRRRIGG